jgi:hypothetical protein
MIVNGQSWAHLFTSYAQTAARNLFAAEREVALPTLPLFDEETPDDQ